MLYNITNISPDVSIRCMRCIQRIAQKTELIEMYNLQ